MNAYWGLWDGPDPTVYTQVGLFSIWFIQTFEITWNKLEKNTIVLAQKYIFT